MLRTISAAAFGAAIALGVTAGPADAFPERSIRLVVSFPPGGAADFLGRLYAQHLGEELGVTVVVENRPGASGSVGARMVAEAAPDGYTLVLGSVSSHATSATMMPDAGYHPVDSFTPIHLMAMVPTVMVVNAGLGVDSVDGFVELAKRQPGEFNYGSVGNGTSQHLAAVIFSNLTGVEMEHIPYSGQNTMAPDLGAGIIQVSFNNLTSNQGQIQAGEVVALAVALDERWPELPDVPTFTEVGLGDMEVSSWVGFFAPAGLPDDRRDILSAASVRAMGKDNVRAAIFASGNMPVGGDADQLGAFVASQTGFWREAIMAAGVAPE
jgi:tripartite-type tricarboxylate transporter receptor subunit TctC